MVRADKVGQDTQLAHLIAMVEQAQAGKAGIQRLADRICAVFVPCVLAGAAVTLAGWLLAGGPGWSRRQRRAGRPDHRLPVRTRSGHPGRAGGRSGRGAQLGIFIKDYQALESSRPSIPSSWTRPAQSPPAR